MSKEGFILGAGQQLLRLSDLVPTINCSYMISNLTYNFAVKNGHGVFSMAFLIFASPSSALARHLLLDK